MSRTLRYRFPVRPRPIARLPDAPKPAKPTGPSRIARMLALAHYVERQTEAGELEDYTAAARSLGLTRARMTQVMNLCLLAPEIQERLLLGELSTSERALRTSTKEPEWNTQFERVGRATPPPVQTPHAPDQVGGKDL